MSTVRKLRECDKPVLRQLPQNRWTLIRYFSTGNPDTFVMADAPAYDELDEATAAGQGLTNLRLRVQEWDPRKDGMLVCAYETLTNTFVLAKDPVTDYDLNGLRRDTLTYVARVTADADAFVADNPYLDGNPLAKKTIIKEPGATVVELVYLQPGIISKAEESSGNGALEKYSVVVFGEMEDVDGGPAYAPSDEDFVLISTQESEVSGYPTRTYVYAKGSGEISRDVDVKFAGTLTITTVTALTGPTESGPDPLTGEYAREERQADGHRIWTLRGAVGAGVIEDNTQSRFDGKVLTRTLVYLVSGPAGTPPAEAHVDNETTFSIDERDGYVLYTSKGVALAVGAAGAVIEHQEADIITSALGVHLVRHVYTTFDAAPASYLGEIVEQRTSSEEGYTVYTTTTLQILLPNLPDEVQNRYGGLVVITTKRTINAPPVTTGLTVVRTDVQTSSGYAIYSAVCLNAITSGAVIGTAVDPILDGHVTRRVYSSLNAEPVSMTGTKIDQSTQIEDGYTVYRTTTIDVPQPELPDEVQNRYGGLVTITTKRKINAAPDTGASPVLRTDVQQADGYTIFSAVLLTAVTSGGELSHATDVLLADHVERHTYATLTVKKSSPGAGYTEVDVSTQVEDGYTIYKTTFIYIIDADLPDEVQNRYDGNLVITTLRKINATPDTGVFPVIRTDAQLADGYTIFSAVVLSYIATGAQIGIAEDELIEGHVTRRVYSSLNEAPAFLSVSEVAVDTSIQQEDGYAIYRTTTIEVTDDTLEDELSYKLGGALTLTTKRKINAVPSSPGAGYALISARVDEGTGYTLYTSTYASGTGPINEDEVRYRYNNKLKITTKRSLNAAPTAPIEDYVTLTNSAVSQGDGYAVYTYTWVSGSGLIDETTDTRSDGSVLHTITTLNVLGISPALGTPPAGSYLANQDSEPGDGFLIYTRQYYVPPTDLVGASAVPVSLTVKKPGLIGATSDGISATRMPSIVAVSATAEVVYTDTPVLEAVTPINPGVIAYEKAVFNDSLNPPFLYDTTNFADYYAPASGASGFTSYRGRDVSGFSVSFVGHADQNGEELVFSSEAEVFFRTSTVTIYKVTTVRGTL